MSKGSRRLILAAAAALSITCFSLTPTTTIVTMAQVTPAAVQDTAWARSGSDYLVQGGYVSVNGVSQYISSQFFALDLSTNWQVTSPPWRALSNGTVSRSFYGVSLPTNQTFLTFKYMGPTTYTITTYSVASNSWGLPQASTTGSASDVMDYGVKPVVDPTSGLVYIAGKTSMNIYDPTKQSWTSRPILTGTLTARYFGSPGYNTARKTIMYVGGYNYGVNPTHFDPVVVVTEYSPATSAWSVLPTTGTAPSPRADHCAAISEDGKTLIVFGGRTSVLTPNIFTGSIHILDITTGIWNSALPPAATPRVYAGCILIGDQFVSWAGSTNGNDTITSPQPIVFDVTLKKWVDSYQAPAYYLQNPPNKPNPSPGSGSNGGGSGSGGGAGSGGNDKNGDGAGSGSESTQSNLGLIIGCVCGGLALVAAIVGFLWYRRRQNKKLNEVKEQVSLQRMVIEAERSNKLVATSNNNHRNDSNGDGGAGGAFTRNNGGGGYTDSNSSGKDTITYPSPPVYSNNNTNNYSNNTASHQNDIKASLSPKFPYNAEFSAAPSSPIVTYPVAVSSPVMSTSPAMKSSPANSNNYYNYGDINYNSSNINSPHGPQAILTKTSGPQAVQVIGAPQEYHSPSGRAPQSFGHGREGAAGTDSYYHEQDSLLNRRQNHPQEGNQPY
ncbi:hypothetical protein BGZ96_003829 [Linnemannia gamsii]|uniref:Galactose oxidase n=1 Tax=Linnemannia gamsii TaxID=64522 RepID=A0ABQ7JJF4_9FUNG|nr:hypothetical protein BGZ96_003829 [Linnemannia gamsii]